MSKHTPEEEEWTIEKPCGCPYSGTYIVAKNYPANQPFYPIIAEIRQYREREVSDRRARLIAKAPKMLAAIHLTQQTINEVLEVIDRDLSRLTEAEGWLMNLAKGLQRIIADVEEGGK